MQGNIATIVPVHNGLESTKRFLQSYFASLDVSSLRGFADLFIVDDGSTDGTGTWLAEHHPGVTVLKGDGQLWWSGSVNKGVQHTCQSGYSHVLLFNNDNTVASDYFERLAQIMQRGHGTTIVSSKVFNVYPERYVIYGGVTFDRRRARYVVNANPEQEAIVNTAGGMGVLIPTSVINNVGHFDARHFPQKSGDTDFYLRADKTGVKVHYQPSLVVYNDNTTTGYSGNDSVQAMVLAYSFPKGYMNLGVDLRLFLTHGNPWWALYRVARNNVLFVAVGIMRMLKARVRRFRPQRHA